MKNDTKSEEAAIVQQQAKENALEKYTELFDIAPSGYFMLSRGGEIIEVNLCGSQMLGKEGALLKGGSLGLFVSDDTKTIFDLFLANVFNTNTKQSCEVMLKIAGRLPMFVLLNGIASENIAQCFVTMIDITELKASDVALIESRKLYADLVSNQSAGIYRILVKKPEIGKSIFELTTIEFISDRFCEILEIDHSVFLGDLITVFFKRMHPDDIEEFIKSNETAQLSPEHYTKETRLLIGDVIKWVRFESRPRKLKDGSIRWTGVAIDITDHRLAEEALKRNEERQRLILKVLPVAIYSITIKPNYEITWLSGDLKEISGFDKENFLLNYDFWRNRLHPDDKERVLETFKDIPPIGEKSIEYRWKCRDDQYHWFMDRFAVLENELGYEVWGVIVDNTNSKQAEEAIRHSEEQYRMLLEFATDAFFHGDKNGNFITVNTVAVEQTGYSREELLRMNMKDLFSEETLQKKPLKYEQLRNGEIVKTERALICKNGKQIIVEMNSRMMPDCTFQSFFRDITERKLIEKELKRRLSELEIYYDLAITRERKMIALKSEINLLLERLGEKAKY